MMIIGYARVSTDGQSLESQHASLTAAGAQRVFAEKISGAVTDRKALAKAVAALGAGDVLLVTRLDAASWRSRLRRAIGPRAVPSAAGWQESRGEPGSAEHD